MERGHSYQITNDQQNEKEIDAWHLGAEGLAQHPTCVMLYTFHPQTRVQRKYFCFGIAVRNCCWFLANPRN